MYTQLAWITKVF